MVQFQQTTRTDDLNGNEGATTVQFGYQGSAYEIDLDAKNQEIFASLLAKYIDAARKVKASSVKVNSEASKVREWAIAQGLQVGARGRIHADIWEAYAARGVESPVVVETTTETDSYTEEGDVPSGDDAEVAKLLEDFDDLAAELDFPSGDYAVCSQCGERFSITAELGDCPMCGHSVIDGPDEDAEF